MYPEAPSLSLRLRACALCVGVLLGVLLPGSAACDAGLRGDNCDIGLFHSLSSLVLFLLLLVLFLVLVLALRTIIAQLLPRHLLFLLIL